MLRFRVEAGFSVRKAFSGEVNQALNLFEMCFVCLRFTQIDRVSGTNTFPRLDDIEHCNSMPVSEKLSHNRLP